MPFVALFTSSPPSGVRMPIPSPLRFAGPTTEALFKTGFALTSALLMAALAWWTWHDFNDACRDAEARVVAAAMVAKGHAARSLSAIDAVIASVVELVQRDGLDGLRSETQWQRLRQIATRLPASSAVFVYDRGGDRIAATTAHPPPASNVGEREWFKRLMAGN